MMETKISSSSSLQGLRLGLDSQDTLPSSLLLDFKSKVCFVCLFVYWILKSLLRDSKFIKIFQGAVT